MAEHEKGPRFAGTNETGLHKEISSIFKGVPIPSNDGVERPSGVPAGDGMAHPAPKPPAPEAQNLQNHQASKPYRPPEPLQKTAPAQHPKADAEKYASDRRPAVKVVSQTFWQQMKNRLFAPKPGVGATRQKAIMVLVPVLFVVLILVLIKVFSAPARTIAEAGEVNAANTVTTFDDEIDWEIPAPYPTTYRDPMQPGSTITTYTDTERLETGKIGRLTIRSIVYSEDNPSIVIGGRIVHEGQTVLGATVIKINKDSVEFEADGKRWTQNVRE
jgi:hypothetical protein